MMPQIKNIHSFLLKAWPVQTKPARSRFVKRLAWVVSLFIALAVPVFLVASRLLQPRGIGKWLYWVHDHIYLPIVGYTYTLFYPYSISWWGMMATLLVLSLIAFLSMKPMIKGLHVYVLRRIVRRPSRHFFLVKTCGWLKKHNFQPELLEKTVEMEWKIALHRLFSGDLNALDRTSLRRTGYLTHMAVNVMTLPPLELQERLKAASTWHRGFLHLHARFLQNPGSAETPLFNKILSRLSLQVEPLTKPWLDLKNMGKIRPLSEQPGSFDDETLLLDLMYIASFFDSSLANRLPRLDITRRLASSVSNRQGYLDRLRFQLEIDSPDISQFMPIPDPVNIELSLSIAVQLSILVGKVSTALSFIESVEALDFMISTLDEEDPRFETLEPLLINAGPDLYRLCAGLAEKELSLNEIAWKQSVFNQGNLVMPDDFKWSRKRIGELYGVSARPQ